MSARNACNFNQHTLTNPPPSFAKQHFRRSTNSEPCPLPLPKMPFKHLLLSALVCAAFARDSPELICSGPQDQKCCKGKANGVPCSFQILGEEFSGKCSGFTVSLDHKICGRASSPTLLPSIFRIRESLQAQRLTCAVSWACSSF